jgi:hypothetical protein
MEFGNRVRACVGLFAFGIAIVLSGCSTPQLPPGMIGRLGKYDYSPSVIQSGDIRQFWWCGYAFNPTNSSQESDTILYESVNQVTGEKVGPLVVLAESAGKWDSLYTCNPKVIGGSFNNPLGDGRSFQYAMYYVGTRDGYTNNIGVAFSSDGINWSKYPEPVIRATSSIGYGAGQPALYNTDHLSAISMYYENSDPVTEHIWATSTDAIHFTIQGALTTNGLQPDSLTASWGDMAYDPQADCWYAAFDRQFRDPATTGNVLERGQLGIELYRIANASLLSGATPWQLLGVIDTNTTGYESNFIAGFVRDQYGNLNVGLYPTIEMYVSISNPQPTWNVSPDQAAHSTAPNTWDVSPMEWVPNHPLLPLNRYFNGTVHWVTTGWVSPLGNFKLQSLLGHLYQGPDQGATVPFYACKRGNRDFFVSLDSACEGQRILGRNGFAYSKPNPTLNLIALYRCSTGSDHFVSGDSSCEGATTDELLGYVLP